MAQVSSSTPPIVSEQIMKRYKLWLKIEGNLFLGLWLVAYLVKWGVLWHDGGDPFGLPTFHPYFNMLVTIYAILGLHAIRSAEDPAVCKPFTSFKMWGAQLAHGLIAFISVFSFNDTGGESLAGTNYDKLIIACPVWFGTFFINLYFAKKCFGTFLQPWTLVTEVPAANSDMAKFKTWLNLEGQLFLGLWAVAYIVKFGVLWHNAGDPFQAPTIFHPYFNMLATIYCVLGYCTWFASRDPAKCKWLISYTMWGAELAHGLVALAAVFSFNTSNTNTGGEYFGGTNYDKLLVACPVWFGTFSINLYFCKKCFGSYLFPLAKDAISSLKVTNSQDEESEAVLFTKVKVTKGQDKEAPVAKAG